MAIPDWPSRLPDLIGLAASLGTTQLYEPPKTTAMDDGPGRTPGHHHSPKIEHSEPA